MKIKKEHLRNILWLAGVITILLVARRFKSPFISLCLLLLVIAYWIYNIIIKIRYRNGKAGYLAIPIQNDSFYKHAAVIMGIMVIIGAGTSVIVNQSAGSIELTALACGVLVLVNGIIYIPKGRLTIQDNRVVLKGQHKKLDMANVTRLTINPDTIMLTGINNNTTTCFYFQIDAGSAEKIRAYAASKKTDSTTLEVATNPLLIA